MGADTPTRGCGACGVQRATATNPRPWGPVCLDRLPTVAAGRHRLRRTGHALLVQPGGWMRAWRGAPPVTGLGEGQALRRPARSPPATRALRPPTQCLPRVPTGVPSQTPRRCGQLPARKVRNARRVAPYNPSPLTAGSLLGPPSGARRRNTTASARRGLLGSRGGVLARRRTKWAPSQARLSLLQALCLGCTCGAPPAHHLRRGLTAGLALMHAPARRPSNAPLGGELT